MSQMEQFRKALQSFPPMAKLLLVIFGDLYGVMYRISRGDTTGIVVGIVQLLPIVNVVFWVIDLVSMIQKKEITLLADVPSDTADHP